MVVMMVVIRGLTAVRVALFDDAGLPLFVNAVGMAMPHTLAALKGSLRRAQHGRLAGIHCVNVMRRSGLLCRTVSRQGVGCLVTTG
jgi:hypothetical protein